MSLNPAHILSAFMVMFAVIDITGSIPVIIDIKNRGNEIQAGKAAAAAFAILILFLFGGNGMLKLFGVDISSFAIAGALVLFAIAVEMIMGIELFKNQVKGSASIVPIAFPLVAGAGSMTTLISLRTQFSWAEIVVALILNMVIVYIVLRFTHFFERLLGEVGVLILRKLFGVILLAISVKLFVSNLAVFIDTILPSMQNITH
jgi:multiple antibiotic resistance protein